MGRSSVSSACSSQRQLAADNPNIDAVSREHAECKNSSSMLFYEFNNEYVAQCEIVKDPIGTFRSYINQINANVIFHDNRKGRSTNFSLEIFLHP